MKGSDARLDQAIRALPELERFLKQDANERSEWEATLAEVEALAAKYAGR